MLVSPGWDRELNVLFGSFKNVVHCLSKQTIYGRQETGFHDDNASASTADPVKTDFD